MVIIIVYKIILVLKSCQQRHCRFCSHCPHHAPLQNLNPNPQIEESFSSLLQSLPLPSLATAPPSTTIADFFTLDSSGGVRALDLRVGDRGIPVNGDQVVIHYYGRLAAKQGWRFDSTYDHKDDTGVPIPFVFVLGSGNVIPGIEAAVKSMKVGGIRYVIILSSQGCQNTFQEPIPPNEFTNFFNDRLRSS